VVESTYHAAQLGRFCCNLYYKEVQAERKNKELLHVHEAFALLGCINDSFKWQAQLGDCQ